MFFGISVENSPHHSLSLTFGHLISENRSIVACGSCGCGAYFRHTPKCSACDS